MARVKTFANGGSLLPGDLNSIEDDYETAFSTYRTLARGSVWSQTSPFAAGEIRGLTDGVSAGLLSNLPNATFYFDPADYLANTRLTKYRVRAMLLTNTTAPTSTFTVGLYPVSACAGGAGTITQTIGGVIAGSTVAFAAPAASSQFQGNSGDFGAVAVAPAGYYALGVACSVATMVANSSVALVAALQYREV